MCLAWKDEKKKIGVKTPKITMWVHVDALREEEWRHRTLFLHLKKDNTKLCQYFRMIYENVVSCFHTYNEIQALISQQHSAIPQISLSVRAQPLWPFGIFKISFQEFWGSSVLFEATISDLRQRELSDSNICRFLSDISFLKQCATSFRLINI